jgi:hypothetical protein
MLDIRRVNSDRLAPPIDDEQHLPALTESELNTQANMNSS